MCTAEIRSDIQAEKSSILGGPKKKMTRLQTQFFMYFSKVFQKFEIEKAYFAGKFERIWGFGGAKFFPSQK